MSETTWGSNGTSTGTKVGGKDEATMENERLDKAINLVTELESTLSTASDEVAKCEPGPRARLLSIACSDASLLKDLLEHVNNRGIGVWEAKDFRRRWRSVVQLIDVEIERFEAA